MKARLKMSTQPEMALPKAGYAPAADLNAAHLARVCRKTGADSATIGASWQETQGCAGRKRFYLETDKEGQTSGQESVASRSNLHPMNDTT